MYRGRFLIHVNAVGRFGTPRGEGSKSEIQTHFQGGYAVVEYCAVDCTSCQRCGNLD